MFVEIVEGIKKKDNNNVHKPVEDSTIHQRSNSAPKAGIMCMSLQPSSL